MSPPSAFRPSRLRPKGFVSALLVVCAGLGVGCNRQPEPPITLQVGPTQVITFEPQAAFGHYYELPGNDDVLRLVLASYPVSCRSFTPPGPGEAFITVTISAPPTTAIEPGDYRWEGLPSEDEQEEQAPTPHALPFVRLSEEGRALPPGGHVTLKTLEKEPLGLVEGQFAFRDGGDQQASTAALMGEFSLRLCHTDLDPARAAQSEE